MEPCLLCHAERLTDWHYEDGDCWVSDCIVCMTPMVVWRTHGLPDAETEAALLTHLERVAAARYGDEGYYVDGERRKIPDHWHAHARPAGGFFDPRSELFGLERAGVSVTDVRVQMRRSVRCMQRANDVLMTEEARLWEELHRLIDALPPERAAEPGYFDEGWSAKDLVSHIGSWLAEAGVVLEQIRFGTYRGDEIDVDAINATFLEAMRDTPLPDVRSQAFAARERMLRAWGALPETSAEAERWVDKSGPAHYGEHLPRLRAWVDEVGAR